MTDTPTPGQIAYEAYMRTLALGGVRHGPPTWRHLTVLHQEAWEAAAQAVRDHADFPPLDLGRREEDTPRFRFALGQYVRCTSAPAQRWEIWWRACREEPGRTYTDYGVRLVDPEATYHPCRMSDGSDLTVDIEKA